MRNKIFLLTALFLFYYLDLFSQCAMYKAVVESNLETGVLVLLDIDIVYNTFFFKKIYA